MFDRINRTFTVYPLLALLLTLSLPAVATAGGFHLSIEKPVANSKDSVVTVRPTGCRRPSDAALSGTAEGLIDGRRRSVPIQFTTTSTGLYEVKQQWPKGGVWVLAITGTYSGHTSSALVRLGPTGKMSPERVQVMARKPKTEEIEAALGALPQRNAGVTRMGIGAGTGISALALAFITRRTGKREI